MPPSPGAPGSRHPRSTDWISSLELASFFAQLRAAIGVSLDRTSFCFVRVWLRFFAFLVLHSGDGPRLESGLPLSAELPSVIVPTFGASQCLGKSIPFA